MKWAKLEKCKAGDSVKLVFNVANWLVELPAKK